MPTRIAALVFAPLAVLLASGCGSTTRNAAAPSTSPTATKPSTAPTSTAAPAPSKGPGALQAEANSAAAGDIPDNQVFLSYTNRAAGYSMKYPEGWARQGLPGHVTFRDKNNIVRIVVGRGVAATPDEVRNEVAHLPAVHIESSPRTVTISGRPAVKTVYSTESAPNAVTGKRVKLIVDRYYLSSGRRRAVVDLGTPQGVDNVDAYRLMIESFRWS